ncbi:MAG: acylneuraminate cytidylyltransferase family protein [Saprospiraceae bacterium]
MIQNKKVVAIIPARGGSKSIPYKNIKLLNGIPLIAYSIAAGLQAKYVDRVIVSTDDDEIAKIAKQWGAEVPFQRPANLAEDKTVDFPVFEHAVKWLEEHENYHADIIVQLRPTSPCRPPQCVDESIEVLVNGTADSVRGVVPSGQNPYKMWRIENDVMQPLMDSEFAEPYNMPRQKLPPTYWQTGHVEVIHYQTIMQQRSLTGKVIAPYVLEPEYAIDLDNLFQWKYAEFAMREAGLNFVSPGGQTLLSVK